MKEIVKRKIEAERAEIERERERVNRFEEKNLSSCIYILSFLYIR